jgi:hypothetical protein
MFSYLIEMTPRICNICAEPFNKSNRAVVKCMCEFECCRQCAKTFLLGRVEDASCMSCNVGWNREFMSKNFEKTFMTRQYKEHREEILIDRELGMLQATQPYVEREIRMEKLQEEIRQCRYDFCRKLSKLETELVDLANSNVTDRKKFVRKCPNGACHGFLSSALKCELCDCWACSDCREVKGFTMEDKERHECDKNILESVKMLDKDSKPCPNCASLTFRAIGCNSMWCVECHASWNWVSGKIETGTIHNPEYFDWLKKQNGEIPRNPLDIICGREIDNNLIIQLSVIFPKARERADAPVEFPVTNKISQNENFIEIARNIIHIRHVEIPRFQAPDRLQDNLQMRISYMRNKIEKEEFKRKIQKKEKENEKKREISDILGMYMNCMTDIYYRLTADPISKEKIKIEMECLRMHVNESLDRVSMMYNCKKYEINKGYIFC